MDNLIDFLEPVGLGAIIGVIGAVLFISWRDRRGYKDHSSR
jgi:hypothetical protein